MSRFDADVIVVGAGPAGQAMALAAAGSGYAVALLDAGRTAPAIPVEPDLRVFALSPASIRLLVSLGAWPVAQSDRVCAYRRMHVWTDDPARGLEFDAAAMGWPSLGSIVEHAVLQHALSQALARAPAISSRFDARVQQIAEDGEGITAVLHDGDRIRARLLIAADGAGSVVRELAGIATSGRDYGQCGLVANVRTAVPHERTAWQRFLASGPLAFLPLADGGSSIVWSVPAEESRRLLALPEEAFGRELAVAAGGVLGTVSLDSKRASFPLRRQLAARYHSGRVALVGDAAHVVHPLAGQGLNLGLLDVAALADLLDRARARRIDAGGEDVLSAYARWRQGDNAIAAHAFEAIDWLYRAPAAPVHALRNFGQRWIGRLPPLKRQFVLHASGLAGRVPSRCRIAPS